MSHAALCSDSAPPGRRLLPRRTRSTASPSSAAAISLLAVTAGCSSGDTSSDAAVLEIAVIDVPVGNPSRDVLLLDLDDDRRDDLLVLAGDELTALLGAGDGRFEPIWSTDVGDEPVDLAAADLDADGAIDVVVANHDTDYVTIVPSIARDRGAGSRRHRVDVTPHPHAVALADIDGDGTIDLLVDDRDMAAVRLFPGAGDLTFAAPSSVPVGGDPYRGMAVADVDGDGFPDLVTPNPDSVRVHFGDGRGGVSRTVVLDPGYDPFAVTAADLDGDGLTDIAAGSGERTGTLTVWLQRPGGGFTTGTDHAIADGPTSIAAADLTGDGRAEVIVTSYVGGQVTVLDLASDRPLHCFDVGGHPDGIATGDVDGDGRPDVAIANDGRDLVTLLVTSG